MELRDLITGVAHVGIRVHELSRSRAFYESLGFKFLVGPIGPEPVTISDQPGATFSAFNDVLRGTILQVVSKRLIVQAWRSSNWAQPASTRP